MHIQYMLLCEFAREGVRGKFDILGLFDRSWVGRFPAQLPDLAVVALACADTEDDLGDQDVRLRCRLPRGAYVFEQRGRISLKPLAGSWLSSNRIVTVVRNMPLPEPGRYFFELTVGPVTATHPLDVVEGPPPGVA